MAGEWRRRRRSAKSDAISDGLSTAIVELRPQTDGVPIVRSAAEHARRTHCAIGRATHHRRGHCIDWTRDVELAERRRGLVRSIGATLARRATFRADLRVCTRITASCYRRGRRRQVGDPLSSLASSGSAMFRSSIAQASSRQRCRSTRLNARRRQLRSSAPAASTNNAPSPTSSARWTTRSS